MKSVLKCCVLKLAVAMAVLLLASSNSLADDKPDTMTLTWDGPTTYWLDFNPTWWRAGDTSKDCTGPTTPKYDGVETLTIGMTCPRSGSSLVASDFNQYLYLGGPNGDYNHGGAIAYYQTFYTGADNPSFNMNPGDLNWVIKGTLQVGTNYYQIAIGEGHDQVYDRNNWWIGGPDLTGFCGDGVLATRDGKYLIRLGDDDHSFKISPYPYPAPNWMKPIPDDYPLYWISMPGTHDSGTYAFPPQAMLTAVVTQYHSIRSQLSLGVRVFDVRLTDSLQICHGSTAPSMDLYLKDVLDQAFEFLESYPSETIAMVFKQDKGSSIDPTLLHNVMYANSNAQYWTDNSMPTLGEVRGKIVVVNRNCLKDANNNPIGINITNWPDNSTGGSDTGGQTPVKYYIQDHYSNPGYSKKADDVQNMIKNIINSNPVSYNNYWYFNYLSCTDSYYTLTEIASLVTGTLLNNSNYYQFPSPPDPTIRTFGTTMLDFAGVPWTLNNPTMSGDYWIYSSDIADRVINKNFENAAASAKVSFTSSGVGTAGASSNNLFSSSQLGDAASQLKDRYTLLVELAYDKNEFDLIENLSGKSGIQMKIGSYEFSRCLGDGVMFTLSDGVRGSIIFEPGKENVFMVWNRSVMSIFIMSLQTGDGRNILDMTGKSGAVSGELAFSHRLHNTHSSSKVSYNGTVEAEQDNTGATIHTWKVKSVNGN